MIIVGERLNSSRQLVFQAMKTQDAEFLVKQAVKQEQAGANYLDLNAAALMDDEIPTLNWAIPLLQNRVHIPLSLDTPNPEAMEAGLRLHEGTALLNSLTGEAQRLNSFLPLIKEYKPQVVFLCLDDGGVPKDSEKELEIARRGLDLLNSAGIEPQSVFIDPLVHPVGVDQNSVKLFLESLEKIKMNLPEANTIAGISNVSFGLPERAWVNRTFLVMAASKGLDAAILDPLDKDIQASLVATQALLGRDASCKNYLSFVRASRK